MKKNIKSIAVAVFALGVMSLNSCSDDFLIREPQDSITLENYFSSNDQVRNSTNAMYSKTWFNFHNKAFFAIGEVGSGNSYTGSSDVNSLRTLTISGTDVEMVNAWKGLWATIAQANMLISLLPERVGPEVDPEVVDVAIGEAHFMRATAYFYLVRLWGPVPIVENNLDNVENPQIPTNPVEDIYQFIELEYNAAINMLPEKIRSSNYADNGRVSKGSAKAMLAKAHLYQGEYSEAKQLAEEVINSGEFKLYGGEELPSYSFGDLFLTANNNNEESIFALQWKVTGNYGTASNCNTQFGYSPYINQATYGGVFAPSMDLLASFEDGDLRRKETVMLPGDFYPNITTADGPGLTVPDDIDAQGTGSGIKKYVVGKGGGAAGPFDNWGMMENNTYIMRYAEVLLIHAEAILGGAESTSDAAALASYNKVRNRAGLPSVTSFTFDELFHERRIELAFEGDYWYDLGRLPLSKAADIISNQDRGFVDNPNFVPIPSGDFFILPYPTIDLDKNPKLGEPPVPYNFD
ncbi:RagB/SusD family nutrient uptake outer membrane protein [Flavobacterium alkalisoli]|uniref:RagB/SusD family nutrient uptake outer membrane protein n=1 Tax=Flavobacterium alkalisoli TaxID=2602769 RepID=A0A5B9FQ83_9FLAO|nr:RagB/SusD family nutrient uptake outer membrane protein [Flavobacterium alkalisoli]QEE48166.1 RagB/SusD family nutrient uptake outer membrane protein [Flavobacterium alkalisoli]